jgi:CelD/BcsL family acetyltransferase involved in cellulose biosynthesis
VLDADSVSTLATLERIEAASWVAGGDAKFIGAANRRFWAALAAGRGRACEVVFWLLYCGDEPVAFSAHFETPCVVYIVANSFDDRWKIHSPGSLLTFEVLRDAVTRGKNQVDWGQGDSGYKGRWGAKPSSMLFDVMLFKPGWVGSSLHAAARLRLRDWREPGG